MHEVVLDVLGGHYHWSGDFHDVDQFESLVDMDELRFALSQQRMEVNASGAHDVLSDQMSLNLLDGVFPNAVVSQGVFEFALANLRLHVRQDVLVQVVGGLHLVHLVDVDHLSFLREHVVVDGTPSEDGVLLGDESVVLLGLHHAVQLDLENRGDGPLDVAGVFLLVILRDELHGHPSGVVHDLPGLLEVGYFGPDGHFDHLVLVFVIFATIPHFVGQVGEVHESVGGTGLDVELAVEVEFGPMAFGDISASFDESFVFVNQFLASRDQFVEGVGRR